MGYKLTELSPIEMRRYMSQMNVCEVGLSGQKKLKSASVAIIGAGGLGCAALLYLAAAGIGKIGIIDHDRVELSNLQRQIIYCNEDIGELKCEVAKQRASSMNPHGFFHSVHAYLTSENAKEMIQDYDVVIDATDNYSTRCVISDACIQNAKPVVYGSIHHFEGQVALFNVLNSEEKRGPNYRSLYPTAPDPDFMASCAVGGVIAALPGIIGSIQALETIKLILQIGQTLSGRLLRLNALTWDTRIYQIAPQNQRAEQSFEISVETFHRMLVDKVDVQLIDIREDSEGMWNENVHFIRLPFSTLTDHQDQIPRDKMTILCCQKGFRSIQAAKMLKERFHLKDVYSLKGGISLLEKQYLFGDKPNN